MRKIALLMSLVMLFVLSACTIEIDVENQSYNENAYQIYHSYLEHDIILADQFVEMINDMTYEVLPGVVRIDMTVRDLLTFETIETYEGSGIIIEQTLNRVIVLTSSRLANEDETIFVDYDLFDYKNEFKETTLLYLSEEHGLALLQFTKPSDMTYPNIILSEYKSTQGEPIVILGRHKQIINAMTMGFIEEVLIDDKQLIIQSEISEYGLGETLYNIKKELIGMYTILDDISNPVFVDATHIQAFLDLYQESLETEAT